MVSDPYEEEKWTVLFHDEFRPEVLQLDRGVRRELAAHVRLLELVGPNLGRPRADTLKGSKHANMKELRFNAEGGVWRVAYAFDPRRRAVLLTAADKSGVAERRFYRAFIGKADARFADHIAKI